jgi:biofilm PGA synthesis protein PgaD
MNATYDDFCTQLYIHRPTLQERRSRLLFRAVTVAAWGVYLYLWLPLATLLLWWSASRLGVHELAHTPEHIDFDLFRVVAEAFAVAVLLMIGWAEYNRLRFQGIERRKPHPPMDPLETADAMHASRGLALELQNARRVVIQLDADAVPRGLQGRIPLHPRETFESPVPA